MSVCLPARKCFSLLHSSSTTHSATTQRSPAPTVVPATSAALPKVVPGVCRIDPGVTLEKSRPLLPAPLRGVAIGAIPPFSSSPFFSLCITGCVRGTALGTTDGVLSGELLLTKNSAGRLHLLWQASLAV